MKRYFKKLNAFLYICIALIVYGCSEEQDFVKQQNYKKIKMEDQSFDRLLQLPVFNDAYQKVVKAKSKITNSTMGRTALEEQYGFDIVPEVHVRILSTTDQGMYYMLLIERPIKEDLKFENLIINVKDSEVTAAIIKYEMANLAQKIDAIDSYIFDFTDTNITSLVVDGKMMYSGPCVDVVTLMCNQSWTTPGGTTTPHVATAACLTSSAGADYLSVVTTQIGDCSSGGGSNGPSGPSGATGPAAGGGGATVGSVFSAPLPCIECIKDDDCNTSKEDLIAAFPNLSNEKAETLANLINQYGKDYGITTKYDLQHFLSQTAHETGNFSNLASTENMNYTTTARILKIFPNYFSLTDPSKEDPNNYVSNPTAIGNYVYCFRMGNSSIASGDGYRYRGRGLIQLTGKDNYQDFQNDYNSKYNPDIDLINNPDLLGTDENLAILSALWYFNTYVIKKTKLKDGLDETVIKVTRKVNKGTNGLPDRKTKFESCQAVIDCIE